MKGIYEVRAPKRGQFPRETITTARAAGVSGVLLARLDSAFDNHAVVSTCIRTGVRFSITTRVTRTVRADIVRACEWAVDSQHLRSTKRRDSHTKDA